MQAVILAAGRGTRLAPVSHFRSKAMAPVAGKPMVRRIIDLLSANGIEDFLLIVGPDDNAIRQEFASTQPGLNVQLIEQPERLGMAHALSLATPYLTGDFLLTACDNLVPPEHIAALITAHRTRNASATLSLQEVPRERIASTGIVDWQQEKVRRIVEKPHPDEAPSNISSLPLYLFSLKIIPILSQVKPSPRGEYELQDAIQLLIDTVGGVTGVFAPWRRQITNLDDLLLLNRIYLDQEMDQLPPPPSDAKILPPVWIDSDVQLSAGCTIGPHAAIERGVIVGAGAVVQDAIVLTGSTVAPGARIEHMVLAPQAGS